MEEKEVVVNYEEILTNMYGEMQAQTELLAEIKEQDESLLDVVIKNYEEHVAVRWGVNVIAIFMLLNFCWSCVRQWRINVLKMGE